MKIKIYQINLDRDKEAACFADLEWLRRSGIPVRREIYDLVYEGEVHDDVTLEDIYRMFNFYLPLDFFGRRLSVSDVVDTPEGLFFCDSIGWKKIEWDKALSGE